MNALMESARGVDTAWCKQSLHEEAKSKDAGDTYCALGHMALALANQRGLIVSDDFAFMSIPADIEAYDKARQDYSDYVNSHLDEMGYVDDDYDPVRANALNRVVLGVVKRMGRVYDIIAESAEGKILAETIMANYSERLGTSGANWMRAEDYDEVIWQFNDHTETTREDVVAMMEKAGVSLEDNLVADILEDA